jgi:hypothetical protein
MRKSLKLGPMIDSNERSLYNKFIQLDMVSVCVHVIEIILLIFENR